MKDKIDETHPEIRKTSDSPPPFFNTRHTLYKYTRLAQNGSSRAHLLRRFPLRTRQHRLPEFPGETSQRTPSQPAGLSPARDGAVFLQSAARWHPPAWCGCVQASGAVIQTVCHVLSLVVVGGVSLLLTNISCAGGLTAETTSWEPLRLAKEDAERTRAVEHCSNTQ